MIRWHKVLIAASLGAAAALAACGGDDSGIDAPVAIDAPPAGHPVLAVAPLTADFGSVVVGSASAPKTFTISNTGNAATGAINATVTGGAASDFAITANTCSATLAAGANCTVDVTFTPSVTGARSVTVSVSADPGGTVSGSLTGTGASLGMLSIAPPSQSFPNTVIGATSTTSVFTVTNTGASATGSLTVTSAGTDPADFTKTADTCNGQTLAANATCAITVAFAPTATGARTAEFDVVGAPGGMVVGNVTGTGLAQAQVSLAPAQQDFGSLISGTAGANVPFTVTNTGGVATGALANTVTGTNAADFIIASSTCAGVTLAAGANCSILVHFKAGAAGPEAAVLNVTGTPGGNAASTLLGTSLAVGSITIAPPTQAFANTVVGASSVSQVFTVTNTGGSATGTLSTALGGNDPSQFQIVAGSNGCQGVVLAAGNTCTIAVTFSPTAGGAHTAALSVTGTPGGTATSGLSGTGLTAATLSINPASNDYGSVAVAATSAPVIYTVTNTGDQTSSAVTVALGGTNQTQFAITANTCGGTLAKNVSCQVQVAFSPTSPGAKSATLTASATTGGQFVATLFGDGNDSDLTISSPLANFATTNIGDTAATLTFIIKNTGGSSSGTIVVDAPTGANAADFSSAGCNGTILGAGASCTVTVTFKPSTTACLADAVTGLCERDGSFTVHAAPGGSVTQPAVGFAQPRLQIANPVTVPVQASSWATDSFAFADEVVNTTNPATQTFTLTNHITGAGGSTSTIATAPASLTAPFSITSNTCTGTIGNNGGTCQVAVKFLPTTKVPANATLTFTIAGVGVANTTILSLSGKGVDSLFISNPTTFPVNFGTIAIGSASAPQTITVTNPSSSPTTGAIQTSTTGPFHVTSDNCSGTALAGNNSCTITMIFTPTATGAASGTVVIDGNPGGTTSATLSGTGVGAAALTLSATSEDFGSVFSGENSGTAGSTGDKTITVTNAAGAATSGVLTISNPTLVASKYSLFPGGAVAGNGDCITGVTTLAAGANCKIRIRYTPTAAFSPPSDTSTFTVSATPGLATATVSLTGKSVSDISITPGTLAVPFAFGSHDANTTTSQDFTVTNLSNSTITFASSTLAALAGDGTTGMSVTANTCTGTLAKGLTCKVTVQFAATAGINDTASLTVLSNLGGVTSAGVAATEITAIGLTAASFAWNLPGYSFGSVLEGTTGQSEIFKLTNSGGSTGTVGFSSTGAADYTIVNGCGATLAGGASCNATVTFKPSITGSTSGRIGSVTGGGATLNFNGTGIQSGSVTVSPGAADFGSVVNGQSSGTQVFTVQNGALSAQALSVSISGNFAITATTCGGSLAAGANCTVTVKFQPASGGGNALTGTLTINGSGTTASLNGVGLSDALLVFLGCTGIPTNQIPVGTTVTETCGLKNTGGVPSGAASFVLSGPDSGQFATASPGTGSFNPGSGVIANTACGALAPGATCTFDFTAKPSTVGNKNATLTITATPGGGAGGPFPLSETGVNQASLGISPSAPITGLTGAVAENDPTGTTFTFTNLGDVSTGQLTFTLSNSTDFFIIGGNCGSFVNGVFTGNVGGIPQSSTCQINVRFVPQSLANGLTTTLTVTGSPGGTVSNTLTGNGTSALTTDTGLTVGTAFNFGTIAADSSSAVKVITFTNNASIPTGLLTTSLAQGGLQPTDFAIEGQVGSGGGDTCEGISLGAGSACTINLVFVPESTGAKTATLTVSGTPGNSATTNVKGTGN